MILFDNIYKNKKVLITGDTGFKGSWLAIWLNMLGADVYGYSLPAKTKKDNFVTANLSKIVSHKDGDIRAKDHLSKYFQNVKPDIAFHLAAQPLVIDSYKEPHYTFETNLMGVVNFFEAVRNTPTVKVAINITSDKCYQNNEWVWGYRENDPMGGKDPYSASKGASEIITNSYLNSFFQQEGTCNIASVRAGNVIGGGDWAENRIIPDFFRSIEENKPLYIRYPSATRPWQYVLEPLSGYLLLASKLFSEGKIFSGGWNFGPGDSANHTVTELIHKVIKDFGKGSIEIEKNLEKFHEAGLLKLDISKAQKYLGWNSILDFDETVRLTANGYREELNNNDIFDARVEQINQYISIGEENKVCWVNN